MPDPTPMTSQDYDAYLDDEVKAFIDETNSWYPPDSYEKTIQEQRVIYDNMCRAFFQGYPDRVTSRDVHAGHVPLRHYTCATHSDKAVVVYAHGGSNMLGGLHSHDDVCADIAGSTGLDVVAVDYRLAPKFTQRDSLEDCALAVDWVRTQLARPLILAGDSAGGYLAFGTALAQTETSDVLGIAMIYSGFGPADDHPSMVRHAHAPLLSADEVRLFQGLSGRADQAAVLADARRLSALPPVYLAPAECDPICDVSVSLAEQINAAGGYALCQVDRGLVHGHLRARHRSQKAKAAFERFNDAISKMAKGAFAPKDSAPASN